MITDEDRQPMRVAHDNKFTKRTRTLKQRRAMKKVERTRRRLGRR